MANLSTGSISRQQILNLYHAHLRVARSFNSYNFKEYFLRQSRDKFRVRLPALVAQHDGQATADGALSAWYKEAQSELATLKRAAIVNRLYQVGDSLPLS